MQKKREEKNVSEIKEKAFNTSIKEISTSSFSSSIGETYITPFALALKANSVHIGILSALSGLTSPIAQFFGSRMMENHSRRKIVTRFALYQAITWIPIVLLALFFFSGIVQYSAIYLLIILYSLFSIFGGLTVPAWFSWLGDLMPENEKGKKIGKRNLAGGIVGIFAVIFGAFILDIFKTKGIALFGFILIFSLASIFRIISYMFLKKIYSPEFKLKKGYYFSIISFIKRKDNFERFTIYQALFNFALMIASPFFAVYMLNELKFSYTTFMLVNLSSSIFYLIFTPLVGKFSDRYGNKKLLYLATVLFAINPVLWMIIKKPLLLILIPQVIVGLANAAIIIGTTNFTYDAVSKQKRGICVAYLNIISGIGIFLGSILGGLLIKYIHFQNTSSFMLIFLISAILRFILPMIVLPKIKEEKKVKRLPPMHIQITHPFKTVQAEIGWFRHFFK